MNAIKELITEHEAVGTTLRILDRITEEIEKTAEIPNPEHLKQLLEFFSVFVDKCHHGKEEELLFPALEAVGIRREGGPIGVMLNEHRQGRDLVAKMSRALSQYLTRINRKEICHQGTKTRRILFCYLFLVTWYLRGEKKKVLPWKAQNLQLRN